MMDNRVLFYILSFLGIWFGSRLVISSIEKFSRRLRLSTFSVSFLLLGLFTSLGEISVGINSVLDNDPEIFVGNLIGASIVLFLLATPLLAMGGRGIKISEEFQKINLIVSLTVVAIPVLLTLDGSVTKRDGVVGVLAFITSVILIESKKGFLSSPTSFTQSRPLKKISELLKVAVGAIIIYFCSKMIVEQTMYFSQVLKLSPFFISLLMISVGTNLPELSLVIQSVINKKDRVAFGDFIGSAVYNTLIFGVLAIWYGKPIYLTNSYMISLLTLVSGLILFYHFAKSKNTLSRKEGFILFSLYILFVILEIVSHLA